MDPLYLRGLNAAEGGPHGPAIEELKQEGLPIPHIMRLTAFKPSYTVPLIELTHEVMRGPSPLPAGTRELIAAFTSSINECAY